MQANLRGGTGAGLRYGTPFCIYLLCLAIGGQACAEEAVLDVRADTIVVEVADESAPNFYTARCSGRVRICYKNMELSAEEALYNSKSGRLQASGNVTLLEDGSEVTAEKIEYHIDSGRMQAAQAGCHCGDWFIRADEAKKTDTGYELLRSSFTTCNLENPHYKFRASRLKIYPGERLLAHNVVLYAGRVPLFYLPVLWRSLKEHPSGLMLYPGYSRERGLVLLGYYNWYLSGALSGRWYLDYLGKTGIGKGLDVHYQSGQSAAGYLFGYHIDEEQAPSGEESPEERWKLHLRHRQRLPGHIDTILRVDKLSDISFNDDYLNEQTLRLFTRSELENHAPTCSFSATMDRPQYIAGLFARKRINDFATVVEALPSLSLSLKERSISDSPFHFSADTTLSSLRLSPGEEKTEEATGRLQLSSQSTIGWLKAEPSVVAKGFWHSRDKKGLSSFQDGLEARLGLTTGNGIWKIFEMKGHPLIESIRHLVEPQLIYTYCPKPGEEAGNVYDFCNRPGSQRELIELGLINRIQKKLSSGKKVDIARVDLGTSYNLISEEEPLSNINMRLKGFFEKASLETGASFDTYEGRLESLDNDLNLRIGKWKAGGGTRFYEPSGVKKVFDAAISLDGALMAGLRLGLSTRYDLNNNRFKLQQVSLIKDLHCWEGQLFCQRKHHIEEPDELNIFIGFRIKALPGGSMHIPVAQ